MCYMVKRRESRKMILYARQRIYTEMFKNWMSPLAVILRYNISHNWGLTTGGKVLFEVFF